MTTTTVVNDNRVDICVSAEGNDSETQARRLAADLDRDDDSIDRVRSSVTAYALVWVADDTHFRPPEGYAVEAVYSAPNGGTAVDLVRVDA